MSSPHTEHGSARTKNVRAHLAEGLPVVYLAGPYSKPDPVENTHAAIKLADSLLDVCVPMVPHLTGTWHMVSPKPYETWLALDLALMARCDAVYRFGGESSGADGEVAEAVRLGIPVFFNEPGLRGWLTMLRVNSASESKCDSDASPAPLAVTEGEEAQSDKERPPAHHAEARRLSLCYVSPPWAYFTTQPLAEAWGDDWNDAPYEHNAGEPYEWREGSVKEPWEIVRVAYWVTANMETPADLDPPNSGYSVQQINAGDVAWMTDPGYGTRPRVCTPLVWAGFSLAEFRYAIESHGGTVYSADIGRSLPDSAPVAAASKTREPTPVQECCGGQGCSFCERAMATRELGGSLWIIPPRPFDRVGVGEEGAGHSETRPLDEVLPEIDAEEAAPGEPSGAPDGGANPYCPACGQYMPMRLDGSGRVHGCAASSPGNTPAGTVLTCAGAREDELRIALTWVPAPYRANARAALDALLAERDALKHDYWNARREWAEAHEATDAAVAERDEARAALANVLQSAESWHGPEPDMGHVLALAVIATWCRAALAAVSAPAEPEARP